MDIVWLNSALPELEEQTVSPTARDGRFVTIVHNNDTNTFDEVIDILMYATQCDAVEAQIETWEIHHHGQAGVHFADETTCHAVAAIVASIGIKTEVKKEWED